MSKSKGVKYVSKRQKDMEKQIEENKHPFCNHDKDHWCQNCINFGVEVDLRKDGLGRGHIIGNFLTQENENTK